MSKGNCRSGLTWSSVLLKSAGSLRSRPHQTNTFLSAVCAGAPVMSHLWHPSQASHRPRKEGRTAPSWPPSRLGLGSRRNNPNGSCLSGWTKLVGQTTGPGLDHRPVGLAVAGPSVDAVAPTLKPPVDGPRRIPRCLLRKAHNVVRIAVIYASFLLFIRGGQHRSWRGPRPRQ